MAANGSAARAWGEQLGSARRRLQTVNSLRSLRSIQTPPPKKKASYCPDSVGPLASPALERLPQPSGFYKRR